MAQVWNETINVNDMSLSGMVLASIAWGRREYQSPHLYICDDPKILSLAIENFLLWFETDGSNGLVLHQIGGNGIKDQVSKIIEQQDARDVSQLTKRLWDEKKTRLPGIPRELGKKPQVLVYSAMNNDEAADPDGTLALASWAFNFLPAVVFLSGVNLYYPLIDAVRSKIPGGSSVLGSAIKVNK